MAMFDRDMRYISASPKWLTYLGLMQAPVGRSHYEVFPENSDAWRATHQRCLAGAIESSEGEHFHFTEGGSRWVRWEARPWLDKDGAVAGIVIASEDITARVQSQRNSDELARRLTAAADELAETARRAQETERYLKAALDAIPGGFAIYDPNDRLVVFNKAVRAIFRDDELHPDALFEDLMRGALNRGVFGHAIADKESWMGARMDLHRNPVGAIEQQSDDGRYLQVEERRMPDGGTVVIRTDITDLKNRQQELAEKTALLEATLQSIGEGIAVYGADLKLLCCNDFTAQLLDVPAALFAPGAALEDVIRFRAGRGDYGDVDADVCVRERVAQFNLRMSWSRTKRQRDGRTIEARFNPLPDGGGIFVLCDVTERTQTEERIREDEAKFRSLVEQDVAGIVIVRDDGTIGYCNSCFASMISSTPAEIEGRALLDFVPETEQPIVVRVLGAQLVETGSPAQIASAVRARDGSIVEVLVNASKSVFEGRSASIAVVVDVTARNRAQRELASTAAILATEHESSPDGILVVDSAKRILSINRRLGELFDVPAELLVAGNDEPVLEVASKHVVDAETFGSRVRYLYDHPEESSDDELALKDGRVIERLTSPLRASDGEYVGRIWFFRDISKRRRAEDALGASEKRFRMLVEEAPDAILLFDYDQRRWIAANKAAERLFGASQNDILEHGPQHFYPPEQPDGRPVTQSYLEHYERALAGEEVTFERRIRRPSGEERLCQVTFVRLPSNVRLLRASLVDVTERRAAEAELSEVLRSIVTRQEAERQRIARELHDSLSQYLAALNIKLEVFGRSVADASPLMSELSELKSLTATVGDEVNRLAWELRPTALDDIGLEPAVRHFVDEWARRSGLQFDLHVSLKDRRLPPDVETNLYRALQEGITNIAKHADARKVGVILKASADDVVMIIEDDGKGFQLENPNRASSKRLGLLGMRERLAAIHGNLEIETKPSSGTTSDHPGASR